MTWKISKIYIYMKLTQWAKTKNSLKECVFVNSALKIDFAHWEYAMQ